MDNKNINPEIRFKGFTEDWKPDVLGSLFGLENGFAFKSEFFQVEKSNIIVLTPGNVNIGGGFQNGKGQYYNPKGEFSSRFVFNSDDIFVTMTDLTPTGQTLGFPALVPNDGIVYLHNQRLGKLVNFKCDSIFLFHLLCNPNIQKQIVQTSSGTTVKHTSPDKILNTKTSFPKPTEQKQIGTFFQNLDNLIISHQKKYDKLVILKKAMLVKMFPKNGALVPEIRFKGFSADWVEKEIDEVANRFDNLRIPITSNLRIKGTTPYYGANGIQDYVEGHTHEGEFILVAEDGANDLKNYPVQYVTGKIWVNNHAHVLQTKKDIADNKFLKRAISITNIEPFLVGGGRAKLNAEIMMKIKIFIPINIKEQEQIGNYFENLENQMTLHKTQLDKLNNIKKACFSKMFVAQE